MLCFSRYSRQKCHNQGFWSKTAVVNRPTTKMLIFLVSTVLSPQSLKPLKPKRSAKIEKLCNQSCIGIIFGQKTFPSVVRDVSSSPQRMAGEPNTTPFQPESRKSLAGTGFDYI